ncbi:MAG: hypothetical protein IGR92_13650 [Leptolyngbyaceae cyanobacterium T60_A2020_046]|nr:hypothetical protein [Leptolyngbyaceae cyanobacterium T60_A2020_046]
MWLWLVCCGVLFIAVQGYQWLDSHGWTQVDLAWPWVLLGGVGLAIASNRKPRSLTSIAPPPISPVDPSPTPPPKPAKAPPPSPSAAAAQPNARPVAPSPRSPSISFEIPKPPHRRRE